MRCVRLIKFNVSEISNETLNSKGVYKITNTINNHFYIGSTTRNFKERFKEHCRCYEMYQEGLRPNVHDILWKAFDKYGIENFKVTVLKDMSNCSEKEILFYEEQCINDLSPEYNICKYPTKGGKPNENRKLTESWKQHIAEKSKLYKHSEETLKIVTENNKKNAVRLQFVNDFETLNFNSWIEAAKYFGTASDSALKTAYKKNKPYKGYKIIKFNTQKKQIKVFLENDVKIFDSFNECDRFLNMWRGYTSTQVVRKNELLLNKYKYELV